MVQCVGSKRLRLKSVESNLSGGNWVDVFGSQFFVSLSILFCFVLFCFVLFFVVLRLRCLSETLVPKSYNYY